MTRYAKAIAAAAAGLIATIWAVATDSDPAKIPGLQEAIFTAITTILVFVIPNKD